jgi:hypothetical protein
MDERSGGELSRFEAQRIIAELAHDGTSSTLVALYELATGLQLYMPSRTGRRELLAAIEDAIDRRRLVFHDRSDFAGHGRKLAASEARPTAAEALVTQLMSDKLSLIFEGRRYFLVSSPAAHSSAVSRGFIPVGARDTLAFVKRMADDVRAKPEDRAAWAKLLALVTGDQGGDVTLLRYAPAAGWTDPLASSETPTTPSELGPKIAPEHWIEIELVFEDGTPFTASCIVELPDGRTTEGPPEAGGIVRIDHLPAAGTCKLSLLDQDQAAFAFDGGAAA